MSGHSTRTMLLMAVALAGLLSAAHAAVINVPGDHATIQAAINAANPGDTIQVAAGTYNENLNINKQLTIEGQSGAYPAIVCSAAKYDQPIKIAADGVVLRGFDISNATQDFGYMVGDSGAPKSGWVVEDCKIHHARSGFLADGDGFTITNCEVYDIYGSCLWLRNLGSATITHNWLHQDDQYRGGNGSNGVYFEYVSAPDPGDSVTVSHNYIYGHRVGIHVTLGSSASPPEGKIILAHNTIDTETGAWGGTAQARWGYRSTATEPSSTRATSRYATTSCTKLAGMG